MIAKIKRLENESGKVLVLIVLLFSVLCGFTALAVDIGRASVKEGQLQNAADAAALAAAQELPNSSTAKNAAVNCAKLNGVKNASIKATSPYNGDSNQIEVVCTETIQYTFARLLGYTNTELSARAVAGKTSAGGGQFNYTVFSNQDMEFNAANRTVNGNVHTNGKLKISGAKNEIYGNAEAVSTIDISGAKGIISGTCQASNIITSGSKIQIGNRVNSAAPWIDMPDFSDFIQAEAEKAGQAYKGDIEYSGSNINFDSPIYIDGNLKVSGSNFTGKGVIFVTGNISFSGSGITQSASIYSEKGNISVSGSGTTIEGLIYAPKGSINLSGAKCTITGRVIGNSVSMSGSECHITSGTNDLDFLPMSGAVKLLE